jgi:hypothetical protein
MISNKLYKTKFQRWFAGKGYFRREFFSSEPHMLFRGTTFINRHILMINNSRVYVILFIAIIIGTAAYSQVFDENIKLPKYQLSGNGISFTIKRGSHKVIRMDHRSVSEVVESDKNFNHGVRRGNTIIATGDVPTFAMLRILLNNKLDPDI